MLKMRKNETLSRVQRIHGRRAQHHVCSQSGNFAARSGIQETGRCEPAQARAETEGQAALRFPLGRRPTNLVDRLFFFHLAGKFGIGETLTCNLRNRQSEAFRIGGVLPSVVAKSLFVKITEQVERLHGNIGSVQSPLEQAPEVFQRVRMYHVIPHVLYGVIDNAMLIVSIQAVVGKKEVSIDRAASFHVLSNLGLKSLLSAILYNLRADLSAT